MTVTALWQKCRCAPILRVCEPTLRPSGAMNQAMPKQGLERSPLILPATDWQALEQAVHSEADLIVIDLDDLVAPEHKAKARLNAIKALQEIDWKSRTKAIRMNALNTPYAYLDLTEVVRGAGRATPEQLLTLNVIGTVHVLEAAVHAGVGKVVLASSGAATGFSFQKRELTPRYLPLDEDHPCEPHDEYGLSKLLAEQTCKRYSDAFGLRTLCLRINHNWYLDWEGAQVAVRSGWAKGTVEALWTKRYRHCLEADETTVWPVPGPPPPKNLLWAVTDARDAAQAFRLAVENNTLQHEVLQINGADTCSTVETPVLIARHFPGVPLRAPLEGFASLVSHARATRLLGYQPRYSWRHGDFAEWWRQQRAAGGLAEGVAGERRP